ncbi:S-adenosylmethionine--2-demethylmenaquinone methyltransferase [Malaciobacter mytili]|uniref:ribonuclease E activity regulator RraA n=1 Tax=Malaciobacter mytili TaxID=603050 RepID=UPI00100B9FF6|nr:ribonuclease E activity regulator RraA [Malaciobacter mytili]RXI45021.1 S-adenosylmethionine--2-demethylmenaquinone methyltransferase [Malaciobacter mytili]
MYFSTADLCDENKDKKIQVLSSEFKNYGGLEGFFGQIITIKLNKSNWDLLSMLRDEKGEDKIVVVDVNREFYGIVGDKLSLFAQNNKYKAIIINGYVRDIKETKKFPIGLIAIGTCPLRNFDKTIGEKGIELKFGGVTFNNGDYVYADEDGIILCSEKLDTSKLKMRY